MTKKGDSKWEWHTQSIQDYILAHRAFPEHGEANKIFAQHGLTTVKKVTYYSIRARMVNEKGFKEANTDWYRQKGKENTSKPEPTQPPEQNEIPSLPEPPQGKSYPTIAEKRAALDLKPYQKEERTEPQGDPDSITVKLGNINRGNLNKMYDNLFKTAQAHEFERFDIIVKLTKRG